MDWIKLINAEQWTPEELKAVVREAHTRGQKVAAHAFTDTEIRLGLAASVDDFQHLRTQTPEYPADIVASIRERVRTGPPLYWTITAGGNGWLNAAYLASNPEFLDDPANFIGLPKAIADDTYVARSSLRSWSAFMTKIGLEIRQRKTPRLLPARVTIPGCRIASTGSIPDSVPRA